MQFDPNAVLNSIEDMPLPAGLRETGALDEEGNLVLDAEGKPETETVDLTLGIALARALQVPDEKLPAEDRIKRTMMAIEIVKAFDDKTLVDWDSGDIAMVQKLVLEVWPGPVIYFRVNELLEGKKETPQEE